MKTKKVDTYVFNPNKGYFEYLCSSGVPVKRNLMEQAENFSNRTITVAGSGVTRTFGKLEKVNRNTFTDGNHTVKFHVDKK